MEPSTTAVASSLPRKVAALLLLGCALLALTPWLDQRADSDLATALGSTATLFASVRGVDAVVSSLSGTELLLTPAGIGVTFAPGELLDPIDDLIEQLADVLLWVLALMGVERLGLSLLGSVGVRIACALLLSGAAAALLLRPQWQWPRLARKLIILVVLLRIALPLTAMSSELIARHVVDTRTDNAESALVSMSQQIEAEQGNQSQSAGNDAASQANQSFLDRIEDAARSVSESLEIKARMTRLSQRLETGVNHVIDLLALVILRALLFPALFIFASRVALRVAED